MKIKRFRNAKNESGASAVELALSLLVLVPILFGILEFGIFFNNWLAITHAAREGARLAAVDLDNPSLKNIISKRAYPIPWDEVEVTINTPSGTEIGDPVEVEVEYNISISIPLAGNWDRTLSSRAVSRIEYNP